MHFFARGIPETKLGKFNGTMKRMALIPKVLNLTGFYLNMRWKLLFCHSFWNDTKIQTSSMAIECEGSLYPEQLLAAPVCDRLPHYHFAQWERTQLNSPSEKTENSLGLLTSLSSAAWRAAFSGPGSTVLPGQGAVVPCAGWHQTGFQATKTSNAHDAAWK